MNATNCLNLILEKILQNVNLFEIDHNMKNLSQIICKLSSTALKKSLSCTVLKNIILTFEQLHNKNIIDDDVYKRHMKDVNSFYKSNNLCPESKAVILSCFMPAVEVELISLLKLCSNVSHIAQMHIVKSAVEESVLVQVSFENKRVLMKITEILQKAFILTEGNPAVCYLAFYLCKSLKLIYDQCLLPKDLHSLNTFFQFPHHLLTDSEQELFFKKLASLCYDNVNMSLCNKTDLIFCTVVFPVCFYKMLTLYLKTSSNYILNFLKFLCVSDKSYKDLDWVSLINSAHEHCIWTFIIG